MRWRNAFKNLTARRIARVHNHSIATRIRANHLEGRATGAFCFLPAKFEALALVLGLVAAGLLLAFGFSDTAHLFALGSKCGLLGGFGFALGLKAGRQVIEEAAAIGKDTASECCARVFLLGRRCRKFTGGSFA